MPAEKKKPYRHKSLAIASPMLPSKVKLLLYLASLFSRAGRNIEFTQNHFSSHFRHFLNMIKKKEFIYNEYDNPKKINKLYKILYQLNMNRIKLCSNKIRTIKTII